MNWLEKMKLQHAENKKLLALVKAENRALNEDEQKKFDEGVKNIEECQKMIDAEKSVTDFDNKLNEPVKNVHKSEVKITKEQPLFKNLTDQLSAIKNTALGNTDDRLMKLQNATGMSAGVGSDGGFALQTDYAGSMIETAVKDSPILNAVDSYSLGGDKDGLKWMGVDEDDISDTVFGGVKVYRAAEAAAVTASQAKLKEEKLDLFKLMGVAYSTYELDANSTFTDQLYTRAFTTAMRRKLTDEIINGDGVGKSTGILAGSGLVTVAKESGQTADTITWKNLSKMYHRRYAAGEGGNWAWLVHPDAHEQFDFLSFPIGTSGVPVYAPASMTGSQDVLRGLPVISTDQCQALGDKGDVILADLSDYMIAFKGGIQKDTSIHVQFLTAENAFRFIWMVNGRPKTSNTLTIGNSSNKRGKYITLAARA